MLGPSIHMADAFFQAAQKDLGKPVHAWVVDGPEMLHRTLQSKVGGWAGRTVGAAAGVGG